MQSVDRALVLLDVIGERACGLADAAKRASLPLSTASRLLGTLEQRGAVARDADGVYSIGSFVRNLAGAETAMMSIQDAAHVELASLADTTGEAACLSIPIGAQTLTLMQIDVPKPVAAQDWTGHRWQITSGGSGAVMMATWPASRVEPLLKVLKPARRRAARAEIDSARNLGVCWSHGTHVDGLSSLAAAVTDSDGRAVAAIVAYGPTYRFPGDGAAISIERAVARAAARVSNKLED